MPGDGGQAGQKPGFIFSVSENDSDWLGQITGLACEPSLLFTQCH